MFLQVVLMQIIQEENRFRNHSLQDYKSKNGTSAISLPPSNGTQPTLPAEVLKVNCQKISNFVSNMD